MRTSFEGDGPPIQLEAMPDANLAMAGDSALYTLTSGDFVPQDYMDLGFTHYQVWAVGAAGGEGGAASRDVVFDKVYGPYFRMSDAMWALVREDTRLSTISSFDYRTPAERKAWDDYFWGNPASDGYYPGYYSYPLSWYESNYVPLEEQIRRDLLNLEAGNPNHQTRITYWSNPQLVPVGATGGAGGGGGIQMASGPLVDLPEVVPVYIGQPGAEGPYGHGISWQEAEVGHTETRFEVWHDGIWEPNPGHNWSDNTSFQLFYPNERYGNTAVYENDKRRGEIRNELTKYNNRWTTQPFYAPGPGADGEASYFGDVAVASGGKGGRPSVVHFPVIGTSPSWVGEHDIGRFVGDGKGGAGGLGGTLVAGGGGAGAITAQESGTDGVWDVDTGLGSGGGGGHTGAAIVTNHPFGPPTTTQAPPSDGGRGALSFVDTAIFGDRGRPSAPKVYKTVSAEVLDPVTGGMKRVFSFEPNGYSKALSVPGFGGGSKPLFKKVGSRAAGYSPEGAVFVRLTKQN